MFPSMSMSPLNWSSKYQGKVKKEKSLRLCKSNTREGDLQLSDGPNTTSYELYINFFAIVRPEEWCLLIFSL